MIVQLSKLIGEGDSLMSRSQAKKLFTVIEPIGNVIFDFSNIRIVGQGFVDEVFRVYPLKNLNIKIEYINANEDVTFMIKRSLPKSY